jgi:peptidylprolyl isomerase
VVADLFPSLTCALLALLASPAPGAADAAGSAARAPADVASPPANAKRLPSGVVTKLLRTGRGVGHPAVNDCVSVHYTAWKRDGSLLTDSRAGPAPPVQCLGTMFPGLVEALKMMVPGEERRVWVPARLTYAADDDDAPPGADVTFDVELLEILKAPPLPPDLKRPPASAARTQSGLIVRVLKPGTGSESPSGNRRVKLHFSGWTADGKLIESSVMARQPAVFELTAVIAGWREALARMTTGSKVRIWIPPALAYGDHPRRGQPRGSLVYELELLAIE